MNPDIAAYHAAQKEEHQPILALLGAEIAAALPDAESKVWHRHPVWFLEGNPIVGYSVQKGGVQLLFWSGQGFQAPGLTREGSFKAAGAMFHAVGDIDVGALRAWLAESVTVQWDYKNIARRKGKLERLV